MAAMIREPLGAVAACDLDTDLAAFALVSGAMEVIAGWLRGDFDTSREHLADIVAGLLLAVPDIPPRFLDTEQVLAPGIRATRAPDLSHLPENGRQQEPTR